MNQHPTRFRRLFSVTLVATLALAPAALGQSAISFDKTFAPGTVGPGSTSTLTFSILNNTGSQIENLAFTDNLPAGLTVADPANAKTSCRGEPTIAATPGGSTISFSGPRIGAGTSCTVSVDVLASTTPGTYSNTATLTWDTGSDGAAADLVVDGALPGFDKSFAPAPVALGARSTLTFTIDNSANGSAVNNLDFTDNLPIGMVVADPANASTTCGTPTIPAVVTAAAGSSAVTLDADGNFSFPAVAANATCTVTVDVVATGSGSLVNSVQLLADFVSAGKATAALPVTVTGLALTKEFVDDPVAPGGSAVLEFAITNRNRSDSATGVSFDDDLAATLADLTFVSVLANDCGGSVAGAGTTAIAFSGGTVAPEATCTIRVSLEVPAAAAVGAYPNVTTAVAGTVAGSPVTGNAASDTLFVQAVPVLTKVFLDDPVGSGNPVDIEFTIENTSATSAATDVAFSDELTTFVGFPISVTLPASPCGGSISVVSFGTGSQGIALTGGTVAAADSCSFVVTLDIPIDQDTGVYTNTTGEITATVDGQAATGDPATADFVVLSPPQLIKEFPDNPVLPGTTTTLRFNLRLDDAAPGDVTDADATNIAFSDDLSLVLTGLQAVGLPQSGVCNGTGTISGSTNLSFSGGTLSPGDECFIDVTVEVPTGVNPGDYTNTTSNVTAEIDGVAATGPAASGDLEIAGLRLAKDFLDDPATPGGTVTLEFTLENLTTGSTATSITFTDNLADTLSGLSGNSVLANTCAGSSVVFSGAGNSLLTFADGTLGAGQTCTFSVLLDVPASAEADIYTNVTSPVSSDIGGVPTTADPAVAELLVETADFDLDLLALSKEFLDDPVTPGDSVTLRFSITNLSDTQAVDSIAFTDDLDAALSGLESVSGSVAGCGGTISGTSLLTFVGGSLAAGGTCFFDVTLSVPGSAELGTVATNTTSEATGLVGSVEVFGDPASDDLQIRSLAFSKSFDGGAVAGGTVVLTFSLENLSQTVTETDLGFIDNLDDAIPGLVATGLPQSDVCGSGSLVSGTSILAVTDVTLMPGGSCTIPVTLAVPADAAPGDYENVTSQLLQLGLAVAVPATATLAVETEADLSIAKTDSADPVFEGDAFTYTVTVANAGPSDAANVVVTDTLPAGVTAVSTTGCAEDPNGVPACTLGTIAAGGSASYTILVTVDAGTSGVITNNATVASDTFDPDAGNDAASEDTEVGFVDDDGDGVPNGLDVCPGTVIPEGVPTVRLGVHRYALVDGDFVFDTTPPPGGGGGDSDSDSGDSDSGDSDSGDSDSGDSDSGDSDSGDSDSGDSDSGDSDSGDEPRTFTTTDTGGCSCEQIIEQLDLGQGHVKFGCSLGAMREWVGIIDVEFNATFADGFESGDMHGWD